MCTILYPGESHFGLHSKQTNDFYDSLVPSLKNVSYPENYDLYQYSNPKTKNGLLHLIRKAEFYGMLQKTLAKIDRASMANSIEVRVPFLKKNLVEKVIKTGVDSLSHETKKKNSL